MQHDELRAGERYRYGDDVVRVASVKPSGNWGPNDVTITFPETKKSACVVSADQLEPLPQTQ